MRRPRVRLLPAATFFLILAVGVAEAADPAGFAMWRVPDFKEREKALDQKIGPDRSARETLGNYGSHMVRMIHRVGDGAPEFHPAFVDLWIVLSGKGTLVVGGTLVGAKSLGGGRGRGQAAQADGAGDLTGTSIDGGERHEVSAGDVIHIPVKTPHQILVPKDEQITYLRVAIPDK